MDVTAWRIAGALCAAVWAYLALFRGGFWRLNPRLPAGAGPSAPAAVAAIIPARNEAGFIAGTVESLRRQQFNGALTIVVADDESTDDTGRLSQADRVIRTPPLPAGWKGKLWAVHSGIGATQPLQPDYYLLTDADILYDSRHILNALLACAATGYDLVSVMVRLECSSRAERLLIPAFVFFFFMLYPPAWVSSRRHRTAAAAGGCMLIRRAVLERIGGIEAIRDALIDDCALAARVKASGGRVWLGVSGQTLRSLRPYQTLHEIHTMIARAAFAQLRHSALLLAATTLGLLFTYVLPVALVFSRDPIAASLGLAAWFTSAALFTPTVVEYKAPRLTAFALPLIALIYLRATLASAWNYWTGRGGEWKGRIQDLSE